jgi:TonB family protein
MFETSVIQVQSQAARGRFSVLTASVLAHSAVIVGIVGMSIASVDFPAYSPDEFSRAPVFTPLTVPPPLGTPNGGAQPKPQPAAVKPPPLPAQQTAPQTIPETVTPVPSSGTSESTATTSSGTGTDPGPVGVPWGVKDSPGDLDAPPVPHDVPVAQPEEKIYQAHEVKAPVLISRVDPRYPQALVRVGMPGTVAVRCVIDKNGNVRDPEILMSTAPPFQAEVLRVISQWKYKPALYGTRPVDSYLNLTVTFQVRR